MFLNRNYDVEEVRQDGLNSSQISNTGRSNTESMSITSTKSSKQVDDGTPVTKSTSQSKKDSDTSLLIEYFEGGKGSTVETRRPSVKVKVTPSSKNKSKSSVGHIQIIKARHGDGERSSRHATYSSYSKRDSKRDRIADLGGQSLSSHPSQTKESNVSRSPIDVEVRPPRKHGHPIIPHLDASVSAREQSSKPPTKASSFKMKQPGDEASMVERLGHSSALQAEPQESGGPRGRNEFSSDQMSLNMWRENLLEAENRNKLAKAEQEYQQQLGRLVAFESDGTHWSGTGHRLDVVEEDLDETFRQELSQGEELNAGTFGIVRKVLYRKVTLAVKEMRLRWLSGYQIEQLKQEAFIGQRLDSHVHIIKHVGTYYQGYNTPDCRLHILTFPVATCDLAQFLDDCEEIIEPIRNRLHEMMSIGERLVVLGFHISREKAQLKMEIRGRLHRMLGCLAEAIEWMHTNDVRRRDLKPANILLRPGQILLTDFGISRHQVVSETTSTETDVGFTWGYAAPEVLKKDGIASLARADVYSLGCVFLHILTVIYGPNVELGCISSHLPQPRGRHHLREQLFGEYLTTTSKKATDAVAAHQFIPSSLSQLLGKMLHEESESRPSIAMVNTDLRALCATKEWQLYGACCHGKACCHDNSGTERHSRVSVAGEPLQGKLKSCVVGEESDSRESVHFEQSNSYPDTACPSPLIPPPRSFSPYSGSLNHMSPLNGSLPLRETITPSRIMPSRSDVLYTIPSNNIDPSTANINNKTKSREYSRGDALIQQAASGTARAIVSDALKPQPRRSRSRRRERRKSDKSSSDKKRSSKSESTNKYDDRIRDRSASASKMRSSSSRKDDDKHYVSERESSPRRSSRSRYMREPLVPGVPGLSGVSGVSAADSNVLSSKVADGTYKSGTVDNSKSSIGNPKLLEAVDDAIRRPILPELITARREQVKAEKKRLHMRSSRQMPLQQSRNEDHSADEARINRTDITNRTDRTDKLSYSIPDDGTPVTIRPLRQRKDGDGNLLGHPNEDQTSHLIECFEGGKGKEHDTQRPSIRATIERKTANSRRRKEAEANEAAESHTPRSSKPEYRQLNTDQRESRIETIERKPGKKLMKPNRSNPELGRTKSVELVGLDDSHEIALEESVFTPAQSMHEGQGLEFSQGANLPVSRWKRAEPLGEWLKRDLNIFRRKMEEEHGEDDGWVSVASDEAVCNKNMW